MTKNNFSPFIINETYHLKPCPVFPRRAVHVFDESQVIAILAAKAIGRPLLVKGEPGCGKTQLARAAAKVLCMPLVSLVVNERSEVEDLLYHYDALQRLSDANDPEKDVEDETKYLSPGPLWWAINHESVDEFWPEEDCFAKERHRPYMGDRDKNGDDHRDFKNGVLVLIDEIDKADRCVPNALLEALGNYSFPVPWLGKRIEIEKRNPPLVVITTNEEQELPPAFVRRCLVLTMKLPEEQENFVNDLAGKGKKRFEKVLSDKVYTKIAKQLWEKRQEAKNTHLRFVPGQAEYFDHIEAYIELQGMFAHLKGDEKENRLIEKLSCLTYSKNR